MNRINHTSIDSTSSQLVPCTAALNADTQYALLILVLAIGLSLAYLYFKITFTLNETNTILAKISDLFDTIK